MSARHEAESFKKISAMCEPFLGNEDIAAVVDALAEMNEENSELLETLLHDVFFFGYLTGRQEVQGNE